MNRRVARSLTMGTISRRCSENSSYAWFAGNVAVPEFRNASNDGIRDTVYVPEYDPWLAYGPPLAPWPGWYPYPGLYLDGPGFAFGIGFPIGFYGGYGWGWNNWRYDWRGGGRVVFGRRPYVSHSNVIVNRGGFGGPLLRDAARQPWSTPPPSGLLLVASAHR